MKLDLASIRRAIRNSSRAKADNRALARCAAALETIARGMTLWAAREYGIDLGAPPIASRITDDMLGGVQRVDDRKQWLKDRMRELDLMERDAGEAAEGGGGGVGDGEGEQLPADMIAYLESLQ